MLSHEFRLLGSRIPVVLKQGRRVHSDIATLIFMQNEGGGSHIATIIPIKLSKKAVYRNRSRRLINETVRLNISKIKPGFDMIIMAKKLLREEKLAEIEKPIVELLQKAELL